MDKTTRSPIGETDFLQPSHLISAEVSLFCQMLRKFVDNEVLSHAEELDDYWDWTERKEQTFVHGIWKNLLIGLGLQRTFLPEDFGGAGGQSTVETAAMIQEVARGDYGLASTGFISPWSIAALMIPRRNEYLLKKLAPLLLGDDVFIIASAITEPHAGGSVEDVRLRGTQIRTRARLEGDEWVINGHKLWASGFREANWFRVLCVVEGEEFPGNIAQIFVPADAPGVSTSKPYRKMGASIDTNGDIWFQDVRVPKENRAQQDPEDDLKSVIANITIGRLTSAAFPLGIMKRAYEVLRDYVDSREIAGKPMKEHGAIAHELGRVAQNILAAEGFFYSAAARMDRPDTYGFPWEAKNVALASAVQNAVGELGWDAVSRSLELMGSYGYSREGKMEKLLRDLKIGQIVVGGPILRLVEIARHYFGTQTV
ncbi:MAG: acyl-CoA dehydrogenase family protein [Acidobacteria bacterium]|nr:acyl-CoA dehydrogenase family protein [Acidobacteriota bacterium]